jgi:hypothetical protein
MAQKRVRITRSDQYRLGRLADNLDSYSIRVILSGGNQRLMRPERLANLQSGRGKLQPWEEERLRLVSKNLPAIESLKDKQGDREVLSKRGKELSKTEKERRENRAIRTWLLRGKEKEIAYDTQKTRDKGKQQRAIHALFYLGVDPVSDKDYYVTHLKKG